MLAPAPASTSQALAGDGGPLFKRTPGSANIPQSPTIASPAASQQRKSRNLARSPAGMAPSPVLSPGSAHRLSAEQQVVLKAALRGESFFFTGGAGTGKSFLLHELLRRLPAATTFATATTGIAACAIGGVTLHHWAGIGDGEKPMAELARNASRRSGPQWHAAKTLIVDEV
jgi:ATP-dependent DNA helicase PIF1